MKAYWIKSPRWLSFIFKNRIWHFNNTYKVLYLSFDDGPTAITTFVLDTLKQYNAKATFFCIGDNINKNPTVFKRLLLENHSIANHTQHHVNGWKATTQEYYKECMLVDAKLYPPNFKGRKLFRPPYGKSTRKQRKLLLENGYDIVMWSVLSADFDPKITKEQCLQNVLNNTSNGNIIVFHDSKKCEEKLRYALPKVLEYYSKKGYEFKCIDSLTQ